MGPVLLYWSVRNTPLSFLFRRAPWAKLSATPRKHLVQPELVSNTSGRLEA
jgi:hypothetical protein